jgi:HPt (histidine-containing phosphotransfer) domain-containing protein
MSATVVAFNQEDAMSAASIASKDRFIRLIYVTLQSGKRMSWSSRFRRPRETSATMPRMSILGSAAHITDEAEAPLLDQRCVDEIRHIERAAGRTDVFTGFIRTLERSVAAFSAEFHGCIARGDTAGATRAAHTLKGTAHQLGALALGNLFADIERKARAGDYAGAARAFEAAGSLIAQSLQALKHA